jgi:hypothetical protein
MCEWRGVTYGDRIAKERDLDSWSGCCASIAPLGRAEQNGDADPDDEDESLEEPMPRNGSRPGQRACGGYRAVAIARSFIGWLKRGIGDGTIRVNEAGALVHGVHEGLLLVSPRIFREFSKLLCSDIGCGPAGPFGA